MKKVFAVVICIISLVIITTSCSTLHIFGKNSANIQKQADKIQQVEDKQSALNQTKIDDMTVLAMGTDYALGKETNSSRNVDVAREINKRVISEGGYSPTIDEMKNMQNMIDELIVSNKNGIAALKLKDVQIEHMQSQQKLLVEQKNAEVEKFQTLATKTAQKADDTQNELNKYTAYWGLGAIFLGLKSLFLHLMWATLIFTVIFIVLRALSMSNPLAAAIFGIFQSLGASLIHVIETLIPASVDTWNMAIKDVKVVSDAVNTTLVPQQQAPKPVLVVTPTASGNLVLTPVTSSNPATASYTLSGSK